MGRYIDYKDVVHDLPGFDTTTFTQIIIDRYISKSEELVDKYTNRDNSWIATNITEVQDGDGTDTIVLKRYPVNSITSVTVDEENIASDERFDYLEDGIIILDNGVVTSDSDHQNVTIVYNAGYANKDSIPEKIKELTLLLVEEQIAAKAAGSQSITETDKWSIEDFAIEHSTSDSESKGYKQLTDLLKNRISSLSTMDIDII